MIQSLVNADREGGGTGCPQSAAWKQGKPDEEVANCQRKHGSFYIHLSSLLYKHCFT